MARYILLGHLTRDLYPGYFLYGGAVLYGGLLARRLGFETWIITASVEKDLKHIFPELRFYNFKARKTTIFENIETPSGRLQKVYAKAPAIPLEKVPDSLRKAEIIQVAPVLDEVDPASLALLETKFLVSNPQGWFREVLPSGEVRPKRPDINIWPYFKALVISEEDVKACPDILPLLCEKADNLVVTMGKAGARLYSKNEEFFLEAPLVSKIVDTTGAGDILATAFFAMLYATGKPKVALEFAMCLAAISVTRRGLASVPTLTEISRCLEKP
ncbi:PfkB domain protein [Thermodesulfatator indicus DSM 15286]|uniref:PfkB domain protein n=1 Tax=Thermodesulfatator indicus (strain DSM 15286 / JCM 11887 / CIR29812) TaxID=667014 RepID=F8AC05_THEID|nr:PfkB family carbohydrate kinase [Thermodesulfatator indicus]AEH45703.1 PfkB domain protein [Thermodesulfatator indicus DSM 15286]